MHEWGLACAGEARLASLAQVRGEAGGASDLWRWGRLANLENLGVRGT